MEDDKEMIKKQSWISFRETGLLVIINQILHMFGWCIVFSYDENRNLETVYPARTKFRGFSEKSVSKSYQKVSKYMADNAEILYKESLE